MNQVSKYMLFLITKKITEEKQGHIFFNVLFIFERDRDRAPVGNGAEREGDTESEAGSRL